MARSTFDFAEVLFLRLWLFVISLAVISAHGSGNDRPTLPNLRTEYGTKPDGTQTNTSLAPSTTSAQPSDLLLGVGLMAIPVVIICIIHLVLCCRKQPPKVPGLLSPMPSVALDTLSTRECASPVAPRRNKSKSVSWQSPFETKGRRSHRITSSNRAMAASELHFVMTATPDKQLPVPRQQYKNRRRSPSIETSDDAIPQYRLDRLDSSPREYDATAQEDVSSLAVANTEVSSSPIPMLQDTGEYDSDSQRISMSSAISDDPALIVKLDEALQWTNEHHEFHTFRGSARVMRSSSSLDDFRHDLHHETDHEDPDQITRSSEYSF